MITITLSQVCVGKRILKCRRIPHNQSNQRMHWAEKAKWNDAWKREVGYSFLAARPRNLKLPLPHAKITITLYAVSLMDYDGAYNCVKPLLDALKVNGGVGVIVDDSPKYIDLLVKQEKIAHRKDERVVITIDT